MKTAYEYPQYHITRAQFSAVAKFSASQFAKLRGAPWQNWPNSAVHRSFPFVSKLSSILLKTLVTVLSIELCTVRLC